MMTVVMERLFEKHQKMVKKLTWNHFKKYGGDWDDIYGEVSYLFVKICQHKYDRTRNTKLTSYLMNLIPKRLINWEKKKITSKENLEKYKKRKESILEQKQEQMDVSKPKFNWKDLTKGLTADGMLVLEVLFECPQIYKYAQEQPDKPMVYRKFIREYLSGYDEWDFNRVQKAFQEIRSVL